MSVKLLVDPVTRRVVYLARDSVLPERVMIIEDGGRQVLFQLSSCEIVEFAGPLPGDIDLANSWSYELSPLGLAPVQAPVQEQPVRLEAAA
ncbi:MAG TPA: hypothetical protein VEM38_07925 [Burkholderiales bacterium]|nr:hypothetical protein [Burkholderiales bacterium]